MNSPMLRSVAFALAILALLIPVGCGGGSTSDGTSSAPVKLQGAGATFPNPIYQKWFSEYNKSHPSAIFDYQSIGSGGGQKQIFSKTVDFAGSDVPLTDDQLKTVPAEIIHIPTVMGAVTITYNLQGVTVPLKFTGETIADIYLAKVKKWNDPEITKDNPGVTLPAADITIFHRSDGSGTTGVFTDYLCKVSPEWKQKVGTSTSVNWPVGDGAKGNEGVTEQVKQTPNSLGYVELIYALQNKLPVADLKNPSGEWVTPSLDSVSKAAAGAAAQMPPDLRVSITNAPGAGAYPISTFTYILVYKDQPDETKGKALVNFLTWATHDGQQLAPALQYAPLAPEVVQKDEEKIKSLQFQGKPLQAS